MEPRARWKVKPEEPRRGIMEEWGRGTEAQSAVVEDSRADDMVADNFEVKREGEVRERL